MPFEDAVFFHCANVEDANSLISRGASYHVAIWRPGYGLDSVFMLVSADVYENGSIDDGRNTCSVESTVPVRGSQNLIWLSLLPDTSRPLVGCHSTHLTSQPCPISYIVSSKR